MMALATSFLLFLFLVIVGIATIQLLGCRLGVVRNWLLAPIAGLSVVVCCVMIASQAGWPMRSFASLMAVALGFTSIAILWRWRPIMPVCRIWPFGGVLVFALFYIGWQAVPYGFHWAAYGNADALAYCQSASRLVDHGFFDTPTLNELLGRDVTQSSWFQFGPGLYRCGFDLFLAWAASLTHKNPFAIYMPVMLCLGMAQICGAAALALYRPRLRLLAVVAAALLAMSPLFGYTIVAQIGPQVGGLALMLGLCALTLRSGNGGWRSAARQGLLVGLLGLTAAVFYPEAFPFWGLSYLGFHGATVLARRGNIRFQLRLATIATVAAGIAGRANLLRGYFAMVFAVVFSKATESGAITKFTGFETFKMPHGAAILLGFTDGHRLGSPYRLSIVIVLGFLFLGLLLYTAGRDAYRLRPYAFVVLVFVVLTVVVFRSPNAFGLFKMALYVQPVLMVGAASAMTPLRWRTLGAATGAYLLISWTPHYYAVTASTGSLEGLSAAGINLPDMTGKSYVVADTPTSVPTSLLQVYMKGTFLEPMNGRAGFLANTAWIEAYVRPMLGNHTPYPKMVAKADELSAELVSRMGRESCLGFVFLAPPQMQSGSGELATVGPALAYFNGMSRERSREFFAYSNAASLKNFLVFVNSDKGRDYYEFASAPSYYALEGDTFRPGQNFYGLGRYLLFEVLNPSDTFRVRVSLSRTPVGYGRTALPRHATVRADLDAALPFVGAGAANIFSAPVHAFALKGRHYIGIDFGDELIMPPNQKPGLMGIYNKDIPLDVRTLVAYGRDISAISETEYTHLNRPRVVSKWPDDLFQGNGVEFSGFYEDGWVAERSTIKLGPSRAGEPLVIEGLSPGIGNLAKGNILRVGLAGKLIATESLRPGKFKVRIAVPEDMTVTDLNLDFALSQKLPGGDDRPASAQIIRISLGATQ